ASGKSRALNPLAFMGTCASIQALLFQLTTLCGHPVGGDSFVAQIFASIGPFCQYVILGVLVHLTLLWQTPRRRLLDSVGIALYAGGPAMLGYIASMTLTLGQWVYFGRVNAPQGMWSVLPDRLVAFDTDLLWGVILIFLRTLWLGLAGLRGHRWITCGIGTLAGATMLALLLGYLDAHGSFGPQMVIVHSRSGWRMGLQD
ncbi:MAG TPA: hypothetical protein VGI39_09890, partial [Polyangiaceae bacterium]